MTTEKTGASGTTEPDEQDWLSQFVASELTRYYRENHGGQDPTNNQVIAQLVPVVILGHVSAKLVDLYDMAQKVDTLTSKDGQQYETTLRTRVNGKRTAKTIKDGHAPAEETLVSEFRGEVTEKLAESTIGEKEYKVYGGYSRRALTHIPQDMKGKKINQIDPGKYL